MRRKSGEGSIREYATVDGKRRWLIVYRVPDPATGKTRQKLQRGFTSEKAASKAVRGVGRVPDSPPPPKPRRVATP